MSAVNCLKLKQDRTVGVKVSDGKPELDQFPLDAITRVVDAITKAVKADHKAISAAVFPGPSMARKMVRQDWGEWTLDAYYPMIYNKFYYEGPEWIGRR